MEGTVKSGLEVDASTSVPLEVYSQSPVEETQENMFEGEEAAAEAEPTQTTEDFAEESAPEHWPHELREEWSAAEKRRIGDYTRKTQAIAGERREVDDLRKKAHAYEMLMQNPAAVRERLGIGQPAPAPESEESNGVNPREVLSDEGYDAVQLLVNQAVNDHLGKFEKETLGPYQGWVHQQARKDIEGEWASIEKEYPVAAKFKDEVAQFVQQTGVTDMRTAFHAVAKDAAMESKKRTLLRKEEAANRRKAQLPHPGTASGNFVPHDKPGSLVDAILQVAKEQGVALR